MHLVELVKRFGVTQADLLRGEDIESADLKDPSSRLPIAAFVRIAERARALTSEPGLGIYFGLRMQVSSHGYLGFAAMAASTAGEALELATRFAPTVTSAVTLQLHRDRDKARLVIEEEADFGSARDAILLAILVGIWRIGCTLTGRELTGHAELAMKEPEYFGRYARVFPNARFGQRQNQLVFSANVLDCPLPTADPAALELARDQCERAIDALGWGGRVVALARSAIPIVGGGYRPLEEVAAKLHLSTRTLKRRLADRGTSFSDLLEEVRRERALRLLRSDRHSIEEIAARLEYSDAANFTRAFRRWMGTTPAAYRKRLPKK